MVGGYAFAIGSGWGLSEPPSDAVALVGGWVAWLAGELNPLSLVRKSSQFQTMPVLDSGDRCWWLPLICNRRGERAFDVKYGKDWLPHLSQEQTRLLGFATAARGFYAAKLALSTELEEGEEINLIAPETAEWVASALCAVNHLTVEVIQELSLLDGFLISGGLIAMSSIDIE